VATLTEASLSDHERRALDLAVSELRAQLREHLRGIWLYGSRARGEAPRPESDVDLLVVVDRRDNKTADLVHDVVWRAQEAVGFDKVYISTLVYDVARIAQRRDIRSFFIQEVDRDKIILYGEP
jgi:predicted nucleotidyltransferase